MAERDWRAIAAEYAAGRGSLGALAKKHGIPPSTLRAHARREGWSAPCAERKPALSQTGGTAAARDKEEELLRVTDKLVRRAEALLDGEETVGAREIGELMRAMKNAKDIHALRAAPEGREGLRIEFSPEAEEAAV